VLIRIAITALALGVVAASVAASDSGQIRLTPSEWRAKAPKGAGVGSSGVTGIQTIVLKGDPTKPGLYTILLRVPPNTTIQAHRHPDDRDAMVVSGTWQFGYGPRFDAKALKSLPPGSFYTEPANDAHFARTGATAVELEITGYGPSGTTYEDPANDPSKKH
jgi:quercetin dioxygenase-like cupin family protein